MTREEKAAIDIAERMDFTGGDWICVDVWVNPEVVTYRYARIPEGETRYGWGRTWTEADAEMRVVTHPNVKGAVHG